MKNYFVIFILSFFISKLNSTHYPIVNAYPAKMHEEVQILNELKRECSICEIYFGKKQLLDKLSYKKNRIFKDLTIWLDKQPSALKKEQITRLFDNIKRMVDNIVTALGHSPKVESNLEELKGNIKQIDPQLPDRLKLSKNNFYSLIEDLYKTHIEIEKFDVPVNYNTWAQKRVKLIQKTIG